MARDPISTLINTEEVLAAAFAQPGMRISTRSKKRPTLEMATKAVLVEVERAVINYVVGEVQPVIQDAYDGYVLMNGERDEAEDKPAWDAGVDEQVVEANIELYVPHLSQDWLGEHTIGTDLWIEDGIAKFCHSMGKEFYKQLTYAFNKTPAKILSSAGITAPEIEERLTIHNNPTEEEKAAMANETNTELQEVYKTIAEHVGKDHNPMAVYEEIEMVLDDDDGLAFGAGARLGVDEVAVETLRMVALDHGTDAVDIIHQGIQAVLDGAPKGKKKAPAKKAKAQEPEEDEDDMSFLEEGGEAAIEENIIVGKPETAAAPAPKAPKEKPAKKAKDAADALEASVLVTIKECGAGDTETAKELGVSRQTYTNYVNGKTEFTPSNAQHDYLRGVIVDKLNALHEALAAIDGTEAHAVF